MSLLMPVSPQLLGESIPQFLDTIYVQSCNERNYGLYVNSYQ